MHLSALSAVVSSPAIPAIRWYSLYFLLLMFYSFLGWCGEMIYCSLCQRRLCEKRGFLNGPICPIYGHGALLVLLVLQGGCDSPLMTFVWGALLTSAIEYITSYAMEKLFHMRWWDYSQKRFHLNGRVCLLNSTLFGLACVFLCHVAAPRLAPWEMVLLYSGAAVPLALLLVLIYAADIILSVRSAIQIGNRLVKLHAIHDELAGKLEQLKEEHLQTAETQKARLEEFISAARQSAAERNTEAVEGIQAKLARLKAEQQHAKDAHRARLEEVKADAQQRLKALYDKPDFFERRLLRSFPTLHSPRHGEALTKMREYLESRKH